MKMRAMDRLADQLRPIRLEVNANPYAEGSCLAKFGNTHVMCTATLEEKVPSWLRNTGSGWVTAEYGMLPRSTAIRMEREAKKGQCGRTHEIQRLVGRALRSVVDLKAMGELSIKVDCDVLQADGGTRTAAITGSFVALKLAFQKLFDQKKISTIPLIDSVSAISCGICEGVALLDLDYNEDSCAETDANFVITGTGGLVEIQGTAERKPFTPDQFQELLSLAQKGTSELMVLQQEALEGIHS